MDPKYYAKLLKETYKRIKKADPKAEVLGSGGGEGEKNSYIAEVCQAGSAKDMDIVSYHSYSALGRPFERLLALAGEHKTVVAKYGCTKRVWHTEQGSKADGMGYIILGQSEQVCAVNLAQSYLSAFATGVEKFFWFSAQTTPSYSYAVFFENHVPRPRLVALNGLARVLKGRGVTGRMVLGDNKIACVLMDGKAGPAAALWNLNDTMTVRLPQGTDVVFADMLGNTIETLPKAREVELRLGRPVYVLAGKPGLARLTYALKRAEVRARVPVEVTASKTVDGGLEVAVRNESGSGVDVQVSVQAPVLFTAAPKPATILDLASQKTHKVGFRPNRRPAAGAEVPVTVKISVGAHGMRHSTSKIKVRF